MSLWLPLQRVWNGPVGTIGIARSQDWIQMARWFSSTPTRARSGIHVGISTIYGAYGGPESESLFVGQCSVAYPSHLATCWASTTRSASPQWSPGFMYPWTSSWAILSTSPTSKGFGVAKRLRHYWRKNQVLSPLGWKRCEDDCI